MIIRNKMKLTALAKNCHVADSFSARLQGLIGKRGISEEYALIISPCNTIHMFFMKFCLDIIFVDKNNRVVHLIENIKPWRLSKIVWSANCVIELQTDTIKRSRTEIGDILEFLE
jgi:uncharacterized protein